MRQGFQAEEEPCMKTGLWPVEGKLSQSQVTEHGTLYMQGRGGDQQAHQVGFLN